MKDQFVVEPGVDVLQEVLDRDRGLLAVELDRDRAEEVSRITTGCLSSLWAEAAQTDRQRSDPSPDDHCEKTTVLVFVQLPWLPKAPSRAKLLL